jgi:hypothetical protein
MRKPPFLHQNMRESNVYEHNNIEKKLERNVPHSPTFTTWNSDIQNNRSQPGAEFETGFKLKQTTTVFAASYPALCAETRHKFGNSHVLCTR